MTILSFVRVTRRRVIAFVLGMVVPASVYAASQAEIGPFRPTFESVETATVERGDIAQTVSASGEISAETQVELKFQTSGQLAWVGVKEGDRVDKWQAIAALDKKELEKRLTKDLNSFVREYTEFDDTQHSYEDTPLNEAIERIKKRAQIDLDQTILDVEIRDLALKYATIYSPVAGIVTQIDTPVAGVNITPATATFTVADPLTLYFRADVDETDVRLLQEGQKVDLSLDALPDKTLAGEVDRVAFTSETARGGGTIFPVEISLPDKTDFIYRIGMNGDAEILIEPRQDVLVLPLEALLPDEQVWVRRGKDFVKIDIKTGLESETEIEVITGLSEGDQVVTSGFDQLEKNQ